MPRVYNFSAGPAMLPEAVLIEARDELLNYHDSGMSIMEMSHRGDMFSEVMHAAEKNLRQLLQIPDNYHTLFISGGGRSQFAMVPMNLMGQIGVANYVNSGIWSAMAIEEARKYGEVIVAADCSINKFTQIPAFDTWKINEKAAYLHYVDNETIDGLEFPYIPKTNLPICADMSSNILSRVIDVSKFAIIYAGAQKNIGPAGMTIVIIRDDMLGKAFDFTPSMFNYSIHAEHQSIYNTPPTFAWYMAGLSFKWLLQQGGVAAIEKINQRKSEKLYDFIDSSDLFYNDIHVRYRSRMNVLFRTNNETLDKKFIAEAAQNGLVNLSGHKRAGGMRASLYNAMPEAGVDKLIEFMQYFADSNG